MKNSKNTTTGGMNTTNNQPETKRIVINLINMRDTKNEAIDPDDIDGVDWRRQELISCEEDAEQLEKMIGVIHNCIEENYAELDTTSGEISCNADMMIAYLVKARRLAEMLGHTIQIVIRNLERTNEDAPEIYEIKKCLEEAEERVIEIDCGLYKIDKYLRRADAMGLWRWTINKCFEISSMMCGNMFAFWPYFEGAERTNRDMMVD